MLRRLVPLLLATGLALSASVDCKQGEGDRCEIEDDCASGLRCCPQGTCQADCLSLIHI